MKYQYRRGEKCSQWKGGKHTTKEGYVKITLKPEDSPFYPMCWARGTKGNSFYVFEHRLVMARYIGRCLLPSERVHHINGDKGDNRIENLNLLSSQSCHKDLHPNIICPHCRKEFVLINGKVINSFI